MWIRTLAIVSGLGKYKSCISNIDAANPRFIGGAITNVAQFAVHLLLGSQPLLLLAARSLYLKELCACATCENGAQ